MVPEVFRSGRALSLLVLLLVGLSCSTRPRPLAPAIDLDAGLVRVSATAPHVFFRGPAFDGLLTTRDEILLDDEYLLEFRPVILDPRAPSGLEIRVYVLAAEEETLLATIPASHLRRNGEDVDRWFEYWRTPTSIDLSQYEGQSVRLKWVLGDAAARVRGKLLRLRLRLKRPAAQRPPDVLLICSDTHRYDYSLGDKGQALMPGLNRLAEESTVYHNAFSTASWTLPAVASTLTGHLPRFHGTGLRIPETEADDPEAERSPVHPKFGWQMGKHTLNITSHHQRLKTLPEILGRLNYQTVLVGGNALYFVSRLSHDGFDVVYDMLPSRGSVVNTMASKAFESAAKDQPLLMLVHYMDIHHWEPWYLAPHTGLKNRDATREQVVDAYSRSVSDTDSHLATLLDSWKARRDWDNTLAIFYSDHGEHLKDPRVGHGQTMDDVLLHVPLVAKFPRSMGVEPSAVDAAASLIDLPATVLAALGVGKDEFPGVGIPLNRLESSGPQPRFLFADYQLYLDELSSVRYGEDKIVLNHTKNEIRLEDRANGAGEPGGEPDAERRARERLQGAYAAYAEQGRAALAALGERGESDRTEAIQALKALGYLQ